MRQDESRMWNQGQRSHDRPKRQQAHQPLLEKEGTCERGKERRERNQRHPTMWNRRLINFKPLMSGALPGQAASSQSPSASQQELPYTEIHTFPFLPRTGWPRSSELTTHTQIVFLSYSFVFAVHFIACTANL